MSNKKIEQQLNQVFNIVSDYTENNELILSEKNKNQIVEIKKNFENLKESEITNYCRSTLYDLIEKSKEMFDLILDESKSNPHPGNMKSFTAMLSTLTTAVASLDKIDENKEREEKEEKHLHVYLTAEEAMKMLKEKKKDES